METSYYLVTKEKISFTKKRCIQLWFKTFTNGRICCWTNDGAGWYGITKAWIKMHAKISHKTKKKHPDINELWEKNQSCSPPICVPDFVHHNSVYRGAHLRVGRTLINIHFIPRRRKRHLGPVKMLKSITPYKQCEVWGGYNSIRWNWEDTLIKRKKLYVLCMYCISAPLCTYRCSLEV